MEEAYSTWEREIGRLLSCAAELPSVQSCAPLKRLAEQTAKYAQRVRTESPETLLKAWVQDQGWEEQEGIDRLLHMAVLYSSMEELLEALAMGGEIDVARSSSRAYSPQAVTLLTLQDVYKRQGQNKHIARKQLSQEEIIREVTALQDMGHKRLACLLSTSRCV